MTVTEKLYRVFVVDQKLRGLRSRLTAAERFLAEQTRQLNALQTRHESVGAQLRQLKASQANNEGEAQQAEQHVAELRERMNTATSNKEYKALLTEVNTFKDRQKESEDAALGQIEKIEQLEAQATELAESIGQRGTICEKAEADRAAREAEVAGRLAELEAERSGLIGEVPTRALAIYNELLEVREEEAMAPIEIQDRKRHEFTCGSCMMTVPIEAMSALLSHGELTRCVSCGCILFLEEKVREAMTAKK
ncbi:MAG: hypothetical protein AAF356_00460 [Planctomycetota bacterium]